MKRGEEARAALAKEAQAKVVMRRLPPHLTSEQLLEQIAPLPDHDYYYFVPADLSLRPHAFCRAYINFSSSEGVLEFRDRFDGYVFINEKGQEFPAVVEFAAFQKIPKKRVRKRDAKCGTIEEDEDFSRFLESCREQSDDGAGAKNPEQLLEEVEARTREMGTNKSTPLLEYIKNKMLEKQRAREERWAERRRVDSRRSAAAAGGGGAVSGHDPRRRYRGAATPAAADDAGGGGAADDAAIGGGGSRRVRPEARPRRMERQRERDGAVHKGPHGTQGGAPAMTVKLLQKRGPADPSEATPPPPAPPSPPPPAPAPQGAGAASAAPGQPPAAAAPPADAEAREAAGWPRERTRPRGWEESRRKRAERAQPGGRDDRGEDGGVGGGGGGGRFLSSRGGERDAAKEAPKDRDGGGGGREGPTRDAARPTSARDSGGGVRPARPSPLPPGRPAPHHHNQQQQQQQREPRPDTGADQGRPRATNAAARRPPREVEGGRARGERGESEGRPDCRSPDRDGERERRKEEARTRRLRNKERPSIQLYTPGGGRRQQRPDVSQPGQEKDGPAT